MATLIRIGNSQGVRIPKVIIEQAQLGGNELKFRVLDDGLLIQPLRKPRQGWEEQFKRAEMKDSDRDLEWLDTPLVGDDDWEW